MTSEERSLEFEIEVPGSPEAVWDAIATGPGISSWYVPHHIEEREFGAATASFGDTPEMQVTGRVAAWDPPQRFAIDGGEGVPGLAFEWLVEAKSGGTCIVRLVNTGFAGGDEWDAHYDGMAEGWRLFLENLRLHLEHFAGQTAAVALPMATWEGPRDAAWQRLAEGLGFAAGIDVGDRVTVEANDLPAMSGVVTQRRPSSVSLLLDRPVAGTAVVAAEGSGESVEVSIWSYLYGADAAASAASAKAQWQDWLNRGSSSSE